LSLEELFDPNIQERLSSWLDEAVGFSLPVVRWRTAAEYRYDGGPIVIPEGDPAVWNKEYTSDESTNAQNSKNRAFAVFESQPYCAAVIEDGQIASMSYCEKDGPISIFSRPASRRKGYALSCLRLLIKKVHRSRVYTWLPDGCLQRSLGASCQESWIQTTRLYVLDHHSADCQRSAAFPIAGGREQIEYGEVVPTLDTDHTESMF